MSLRMAVKVKLDTKRLKHIQRELTKAALSRVDVGFFGGKPHPSGRDNLTVAQVAAIQEFGVPEKNIPERPFIQATARETKVSFVLASGIKNVLLGRHTSVKHGIWARAGIHMRGEMSDNIATWSEPPNAPLTVRLKGFDNPLVETGYMRDHVEYRVV